MKLQKANCQFLNVPVCVSDGTAAVIDFSKYTLFPGFCDVHVHFREPGFSYKEEIATGSRAAARGGFTAVCTMPNLRPVPDSLPHLKEQLDIIARDAVIKVLPYGSITVGERGEVLSDMAAMAPFVAGFSDDGVDVRSDSLMRAAMERAKSLGKMIVAHCEIKYEGIGYIHEGGYARAHGHRGITSESEYLQVKRDLSLVRETGCPYHVCHISTKETVELIRNAKKEGLDVTCETAPHYLVLSDADLKEDGRFKMNPPIRDKADREALLAGLYDGTIDMIATDHAPHSAEEKAKGLAGSAFGVVGLETAFPVLYTKLVREGDLPLSRLVDVMCHNPRACFGLPVGEDFSVWELDRDFTVDPAEFLTKGRATPFAGERLFGRCVMTVHNGNVVFEDKNKN